MMRSSEHALWLWLKKHVATVGFWQRVENRAGAGTPDVYYCVLGGMGWLELKHLDAWPARASTPVRIEHFTMEQKAWLINHAREGGRAFLLLRVDHQYLLFHGKDVLPVGDTLTRADLEVLSAAQWDHKLAHLDQSVLLRLLASPSQKWG
jgi:hypothetical protein